MKDPDTGSGRTPSDDEKVVGVDASYGDLPPDPDAGLSDEERARIVSQSRPPGIGTQKVCWCLTCAITGPKASMEARFEAYPLAMSALPLFFPRPYARPSRVRKQG